MEYHSAIKRTTTQMDLEDTVLSEISHYRDKQNKGKIDSQTEKRWVVARRAGKGDWWAWEKSVKEVKRSLLKIAQQSLILETKA